MIILTLVTTLLLINYSTSTPKYVDLGHELVHDDPVFPLPNYLKNRFTLEVVFNDTMPRGFWLAYNKFCSLEHFGTHIDAPYHLYEKGWTLDEIPLEHLIAPAAVIDITAKAAEEPNYLITAEDVEKWVSENGLFKNQSVILARTGWSKKFNDSLAYLGHETDITKLICPGFGADSIRRILEYKKSDNIHIVGFGIDTISLDHGPSQVFEAHQLVQGENIYILENMNNLEALPLTGAKLFVMPMKIKGGTGAPTRIIAELPEEVLASPLAIDSPPVVKEVITDDSSTNIPTDDSTVSSTSTSTTTTTTLIPDVNVEETVVEETLNPATIA